MKNAKNISSTYSVAFAERRTVGDEWNLVKWDRHLKDIQYHRLYFLKSGKGRLRLGSGSITLLPGFVYFVPAFSVLESRIDEKMDKYYIHFSAEDTYFEMYRYMSERFSYPATELTEGLFKTVIENYSDKSASSRLKVSGAMSLILADFMGELDASAADLHRFSRVLEYIDENYKKHITLSSLADIMSVSTMYFSNLFKSTFNISPKQYILGKRLAEGQRLLLESEMSVKEIAYEVGFENENYFSEYFSAKVGAPPLKFRNRKIKTERESIL